MKKLLALLLALCMVLALAACGGSSAPAAEEPAAEEPTPAEEPTAEEPAPAKKRRTSKKADAEPAAEAVTGSDGAFDFGRVTPGIYNLEITYENGSDEVTVLGLGQEVEDAMISAAADVYMLMLADEYIAASMDAALEELEKDVKAARRELRGR